jgi:hypothetical protein
MQVGAKEGECLMTSATIVRVETEGEVRYQGVAGDKFSSGNTPGEALDALSRQLTQEQESEAGLLVIVQGFRPDRFFNAAQQ